MPRTRLHKTKSLGQCPESVPETVAEWLAEQIKPCLDSEHILVDNLGNFEGWSEIIDYTFTVYVPELSIDDLVLAMDYFTAEGVKFDNYTTQWCLEFLAKPKGLKLSGRELTLTFDDSNKTLEVTNIERIN